MSKKHLPKLPKTVRTDKRQTKPDDGIATIPAPMSTGATVNFKMREEIRDALNNLGHPTDSKWKERRALIAKQTGVDAALLSTQQCEEMQYSGYRMNQLKDTFEIWILGRVVESERASRIRANPAVIADMHERAFATVGSIVDVDLPVKTEQDIQQEEKLERDLRAEAEARRKS